VTPEGQPLDLLSSYIAGEKLTLLLALGNFTWREMGVPSVPQGGREVASRWPFEGHLQCPLSLDIEKATSVKATSRWPVEVTLK